MERSKKSMLIQDLDPFNEVTLERNTHIYRLHPKDGEGAVFTGVCLSTLGRTPIPDPFRWVPQSWLGYPPLQPGTEQHSE